MTATATATVDTIDGELPHLETLADAADRLGHDWAERLAELAEEADTVVRAAAARTPAELADLAERIDAAMTCCGIGEADLYRAGL